MLLDALKTSAVGFLSIKDQFFLIWREAIFLNPAQPPHAGYLRDQVIIELLHISQISYKGLAGLTVDHDSILGESDDRAAVGNYVAIHNHNVPPAAKPVCKHNLVLPRIYVYQPLNRHDGVVAGHDLKAHLVGAVNSGVCGRPSTAI